MAQTDAVDLKWGMRMVLLDNALRPVEPLLVLACASVYAGGAWGSFKLAESFAYLFFRLSLMGLDRGIVWFYGQANSETYRRNLFASLGVVLIASVAGVLAMLGLSLTAIGSVRGLTLPFPDLLLIAGSIPLLAVSEMLFQANLNRQNMLARILGKNLLQPLITVGGSLLSHFLGGPGLAFWFFLGCLANALAAGISFIRLHGASWSDMTAVSPDRSLWKFSLPLSGADLLAGLTSRLDIMLLGTLANVRAVEIYNVVMMFGKSLTAIRSSFEGVLLSAFSRDGSRNLTPQLRRRLNYAVWAVGNLLGLAMLAIVFWGQDLLSLMNKEYLEGYLALVTITAFTYLNIFGDFSGLMLQSLGRNRAWISAQLIGFCVNLGLNLWLIPQLGALGGVLALGGSTLAQGGLSQILLWRSSGRHLWLKEFLQSSLGFASLLTSLCLISLWLDTLWLRLPLFLLATAGWLYVYRRRAQEFERNLEPLRTA